MNRTAGASEPAAGYRPCVGMMVLDRRGLVFTARRRDTPGEAWQMPQGGIDPGESPEEAALRELEEEIGTANVAILDRLEEPLYYDLPPDLQGKVWNGKYRGQAQYWFAMRFLGRDEEIDLTRHHREFDAWRWSPIETLPELVVPFKRAVYERVVARFGHLARPPTADGKGDAGR